MKIVRPFKYVIAAAAVCILCFSGNGQYMYTVFAVTPENDIVSLPDIPDEFSGKFLKKNKDNQKEKIPSIKLSCIILSNKLHNIDYLHLFLPDNDNYGQRSADSENVLLNELFEGGLPGNRSP